MSERAVTIAPWQRKPGHHRRFSVYDGREQLGLIFESKGVFTAVTASGDLVTASASVQIAANALTARAST
jgi:hypothetical protein